MTKNKIKRCNTVMTYLGKEKGYSALNAMIGGNPNVEYADYKCPKCNQEITATFLNRSKKCRRKVNG